MPLLRAVDSEAQHATRPSRREHACCSPVVTPHAKICKGDEARNEARVMGSIVMIVRKCTPKSLVDQDNSILISPRQDRNAPREKHLAV